MAGGWQTYAGESNKPLVSKHVTHSFDKLQLMKFYTKTHFKAKHWKQNMVNQMDHVT